MSDYTVASGNNLWNICKKHYNLKTNAEIAAKVKEVAAANKITDPNKISVGQTLSLPDAIAVLNNAQNSQSTSSQSSDKQQPVPAQVTGQTPAQMEAQVRTKMGLAEGEPIPEGVKLVEIGNEKVLMKDGKPLDDAGIAALKNPNAKVYSKEVSAAADAKIKSFDFNTPEDIENAKNFEVSLFSPDTNTDEQKNQAYSDYAEKILNDYYDINKDGKVTKEEFEEKEFNGLQKTNEIMGYGDEDDISAKRMSSLYAQNMDLDFDEVISKEELAYFVKMSDKIDKKQDGVINAKFETGMAQSMLGLYSNDDKTKGIIQKYLMGETLTPEEQKIFNEASADRRISMASKAGLATDAAINRMVKWKHEQP
ncbi:MAG: LysM peptidoglycan-binding domain-containing protein [Heliobacteriaceae bacterium]|jgi:hypothetical protein|nr:LysM peptidoglycan-binding domain-containing protein [Heliobacteriaceae bacterium]